MTLSLVFCVVLCMCKFKTVRYVVLFFMIFSLVSCGDEALVSSGINGDISCRESFADETSEEVSSELKEETSVVLCEKGVQSKFCIVYGNDDRYGKKIANWICESFVEKCGVELPVFSDKDSGTKTMYQIVINTKNKLDCLSIMETLSESQYSIKNIKKAGRNIVVLAYNGKSAAMACYETFVNNMECDGESVKIPCDLDITETFDLSSSGMILETGVFDGRDPYVLYDNGMYYMYTTGWKCYTSKTLYGVWQGPKKVVNLPAGHEASNDYWAPEVHKYNGEYYMFTTYYSSKTENRGCTILKASTPLGPFEEITNGHITPNDWYAIDGTLYIDETGQPWMVFVHEWTSMEDNIGSFAAAKLSEDFTHFISEPVELFKANDASWCTSGVTDGCFMYTCADGSLLMLWSSYNYGNYVLAVARSESGNIEGPWVQENDFLYGSSTLRKYDGGHGMIFTTSKGEMYLSLHSPNEETKGQKTEAIFIRIEERFGDLVWKYVS